MKFIDEYRDPKAAHGFRGGAPAHITTRPWTLMEVCGGQTHAIVQVRRRRTAAHRTHAGARPRLPGLRHPARTDRQGDRDRLATPGVIFCSFGDMLRVPGSEQGPAVGQGSRGRRPHRLLAARRPEDRAARIPAREVVFFAVGFETTAPANAMAVFQAAQQGIHNFSLLVSHVLVPPAMEAILSSPANRVQGFLAAGHVCAVMGYERVRPDRREVPGADRRDRLRAARHPAGHLHVRQAARRRTRRGREPVHAHRAAGGQPAGAGAHPRGLRGRAAQVARHRRDPATAAWHCSPSTPPSTPRSASASPARTVEEPPECISGLILQGVKKPHECPAFGSTLHARASARRHDGLLRRRLRRLLPLPQDSVPNSGHFNPELSYGISMPDPDRPVPGRAPGTRRRRQTHAPAHRADVSAAFRQQAAGSAARRRGPRTGVPASHSRPTPTSSARCSFPGAISARWPSTGR